MRFIVPTVCSVCKSPRDGEYLAVEYTTTSLILTYVCRFCKLRTPPICVAYSTLQDWAAKDIKRKEAA